MEINLEKRIINLTDADGNKLFAEVRQYEQYTTLKAVLPQNEEGLYEELDFTYTGQSDDNIETWSVEYKGATWSGTFKHVAKVTNTGRFTDVVTPARTNRNDI